MKTQHCPQLYGFLRVDRVNRIGGLRGPWNTCVPQVCLHQCEGWHPYDRSSDTSQAMHDHRYIEAYSQTACRPAKPLVRAHLRKAVNKAHSIEMDHYIQRHSEDPAARLDVKLILIRATVQVTPSLWSCPHCRLVRHTETGIRCWRA